MVNVEYGNCLGDCILSCLTYMIVIHQCYRQTDRQMDEQTYNWRRHKAFCTHCRVRRSVIGLRPVTSESRHIETINGSYWFSCRCPVQVWFRSRNSTARTYKVTHCNRYRPILANCSKFAVKSPLNIAACITIQ